MKTFILAALVPGLLLSAPAMAKDARQVGADASIPFTNFGSVRDFRLASRENGVYLQDQRRNWYYAELMGPCIGLDFAQAIGVNPGGGGGTLDRFGSIVVEGRQCQISKLTYSEAPPKKAKKAKG